MPALVVEQLSFRYAADRYALRDVTFTVDHGECIGLVGPNGAGKTTLFLCLAGVLPITDGNALVCDLNPAFHADRRLLPARLGLVFQNSDDQLFHANVLEDVAFGPLNLGMSREQARARAIKALERVGLAEFEDRVPFALSAGEKRKAALAGVLAMEPQVLLFDEPTTSLDPRGRRDFLDILRALPGTRLIASHDLDMIADCCPRVLLLDAGRLIVQGPTEEILRNEMWMNEHGLEVPARWR